MINLKQRNDDDGYADLAEINVTPLVDVFLVLLVIFMITAPVIKTALEMGLPQAETANADPSQGITVKVLQDRTIWIDNERVTSEAFSTRFKTIWSNLTEEKRRQPVFLAADVGVPYGDIIYVLDQLRAAGVVDVGMLTSEVVKASKKSKR
ncbi:biopolymer transporter ExbD [bacterium]|nr:biopolymer transporter ExbD [bacterium]